MFLKIFHFKNIKGPAFFSVGYTRTSICKDTVLEAYYVNVFVTSNIEKISLSHLHQKKLILNLVHY